MSSAYEAYELLFQKHGVESPQWGAECGNGWLDLIDRLLTDIIAMGWDRQLVQCKQKFGTLRFYTGCVTQAVRDRVKQAEDESARTCEDCGSSGVLTRNGYWLKTVCEPCAVRWNSAR